MIDTWQKAVNYGEKAAKIGKKATKKCWKCSKKRRKSSKNGAYSCQDSMFFDCLRPMFDFLRVWWACRCTYGTVWVLPKKPLGAAEETVGCRRGNRWVPWEKSMVSAEALAGNRNHSGTDSVWGRVCGRLGKAVAGSTFPRLRFSECRLDRRSKRLPRNKNRFRPTAPAYKGGCSKIHSQGDRPRVLS